MELAFELIIGVIAFVLLAWAVLFIVGWSIIGIAWLAAVLLGESTKTGGVSR
jgi:hypothetical protein